VVWIDTTCSESYDDGSREVADAIGRVGVCRWWTELTAGVRAEKAARDRGRGIFGSEMILWKRLQLCDSFLLLIQRDWSEISCCPPSFLRRVAARSQPGGPALTTSRASDLQPSAAVAGHRNHHSISTPRITFTNYRDHGCPLRSPPPLRDHGELRRPELCDERLNADHYSS
jgi:hypothetical protein